MGPMQKPQAQARAILAIPTFGVRRDSKPHVHFTLFQAPTQKQCMIVAATPATFASTARAWLQ